MNSNKALIEVKVILELGKQEKEDKGGKDEKQSVHSFKTGPV